MFLLFKLKTHQDVKYIIGVVGLINHHKKMVTQSSSVTSGAFDKHEFIERI